MTLRPSRVQKIMSKRHVLLASPVAMVHVVAAQPAVPRVGRQTRVALVAELQVSLEVAVVLKVRGSRKVNRKGVHKARSQTRGRAAVRVKVELKNKASVKSRAKAVVLRVERPKVVHKAKPRIVALAKVEDNRQLAMRTVIATATESMQTTIAVIVPHVPLIMHDLRVAAVPMAQQIIVRGARARVDKELPRQQRPRVGHYGRRFARRFALLASDLDAIDISQRYLESSL